MTDSALALPPGWRLTDSAGVPVSGGYLMFRHVSSATPYSVFADYDLTDTLGDTVYLNSAGQPVASEGSGTTVAVYVGTDPFAVDAYDADGVLVPGVSLDGLKGAVTAGGTATSTSTTPVISKTSTYSITTADAGKLINANPTGGSFTLSLPSAVTAGDGFRIGVRHNGTANTVAVVGTETISRIGVTGLATPLTALGECMWFTSNGAAWVVDSYVPPLMSDGLVYCKITDRISTPPASPTAGARYIITGTPTGVWLSLGYATNDIVESDGNGSWVRYVPGNGWMAWIDDEDLVTIYHDSAWADQTGMPSPSSSTLQYAVFEHQESNGSAGGAATASTWTTRTLNTTVSNTITGASLASNAITLPVGKYLVACQQSFWANTGTPGDSRYEAKQRLNAGTATVSLSSPMGLSTFAGVTINAGGATYGDNAGQVIGDTVVLSVTVAGTVNLQYFTTISSGSSALGKASGESTGGSEVYARVLIINLASLQGPRGAQGIPGGSDGIDTRTLITTTSVDATINSLRTAGYSSLGDGGGAVYVRVGSAPSHSGKVQSLDGAWWELTGPTINVRQFGAKTDGTDASTAINAALSTAYSLGIGEVYVTGGGTFTITAGLAAKPGVVLVGDGNTTIKQGNGANIATIYDGTDAHNGGIRSVIVDGNKDNNTHGYTTTIHSRNAERFIICDNRVLNATGYGVATAGHFVIVKRNYIYRASQHGIYSVSGLLPEIEDNEIRECIYGTLISSDYAKFQRNTIYGFALGLLTPIFVDSSGDTLTWVSGATWGTAWPGMFVTIDGGQEFVVTEVTSATSLKVDISGGALPTLLNTPVSIGTGDIIGSTGSYGLIANNTAVNAISFGIGIILQGGTANCAINLVGGNHVSYTGKTGIIVARDAGTGQTYGTSVVNNILENCGVGGGVGTAYDTSAIVVQNGATPNKVLNTLIDGNTVKGGGVTVNWLKFDSNIAASSVMVGINNPMDCVNGRAISGSHTALMAGSRIPDAANSANVTWAADTANPSLGNGTKTCAVQRDGNFIWTAVKLTIGTTTTLGTGPWYFTLPSPYDQVAAADATGTAIIFDNGTAYLVGSVYILAGTNKIYVVSHNTGNYIGGTIPIAWVNGDYLELSIRFPVR